MPRTRNGLPAAALVVAVVAGVAFAGCRGSSAPPPPVHSVTPGPSTAPATPAVSPPPSAPAASPTPAGEAEALFRAGAYAAAADAFAQQARDATDPSARARALLGLAASRHAAGDIEGAITAAFQARGAAPGGSPEAVQATFLHGRYLADAGRFGDAVTALAALADAGAGHLQPFVLVDLERAAVGAGDQLLAESAAARLAIEAGVPTGIREAAQRNLVDAALASGDADRYLAELERLVAITGRPADRFALAEAYRLAGLEGPRLDQLRAIVLQWPSDTHAVAALEGLNESGEAVSPLLEGFIYYRGRRYVEVERVLAPVVAARASLAPADQAFATYYLAAALEDQGKLADAVALYDQVPALDPSSPYAHRARYWAARVLESLQEFASASVRYVELVNAGQPGEFSEEAAFRAGYVLFALGDPAGAVAAWDALGAPGARVQFWRGVAERQLGDEAAAQASFQAAVAAGPLDFHGVEAARLLGLRGALDVRYRERALDAVVDWSAIESWLAARVPGAPVAAPDSPATTLATLGLRDEAEQVLLNLVPAGASPWELLAVARQAHELGLRSTAARLGDRIRYENGASWSEAPPALLALAYPIDFPAILDAEARTANIDPLFLAALVRIESYWQPSAVSPVGALGLTQVMPATGAAIAEALNVDGFTVDSLLRPATSLRFGAFYIREQIDTFGHPFIALAAYNGGPGRAARWANTWDGENAASFAEAVDIEETRNYVELVLEAYARYEAVYPAVDR